jgi:hypothetical protein
VAAQVVRSETSGGTSQGARGIGLMGYAIGAKQGLARAQATGMGHGVLIRTRYHLGALQPVITTG